VAEKVENKMAGLEERRGENTIVRRRAEAKFGVGKGADPLDLEHGDAYEAHERRRL